MAERTVAWGHGRPDPPNGPGRTRSGWVLRANRPVPAGVGRRVSLADLLSELRWRGMLHDATPGLEERLARGAPLAGYNGFDPTADSLHVGHLVPIMGLVRFQRAGGAP